MNATLYSPTGIRIRITDHFAYRSDGLEPWDLVPGEAAVLVEVLLAQGWRHVEVEA